MTDAAACTIMTLPPELTGEAARIATEVFPANRPAVAQFAALVEGDEADRVDMPQFIAALTTKYWGPKPRVIPVQFLDNPTATFRRLFLEHANAWDCSVTFAEGSGERGVRLSRSGGGYWSYLGTDILMVPPGSVTMNLANFTERTPDAEWRRVVRHEVGHTLGFPHEHMRRDLIARLDAEKVIAYMMRTQEWSRRDVIAQALTPLDEASLMGTPPEATSIMCYWFPAEVTVDDRDIPGGADLTPTDLAFADAIYPLPAGPAPPPTPPPPPVEPPKPTPPPVVPPEPKPGPEEFGPYDLKVGVPSDRFTLLANTEVLFRFKAKGRRVFVATTQSKADLVMDLLDGRKAPLRSDDDSGLGGNPLVHAPLKPGTYFLRIRGSHPEVMGSFRVKVEALS